MPYPYAGLTAIVSFFVLPSVAVILFLLTPWARRRRLLPWLLAPVIYCAVALLALTVAVNLGLLEH